MKKITAFTALLLLVVMMLTSCGDTIRFSKVVEKNAPGDGGFNYTSAEEININQDIDEASGILLLLADSDAEDSTHTVFNALLNKAVWSETRSETEFYIDIKLAYQMNVSFFCTKKQIKTEETETHVVTIYDAEGNAVAEAEGLNMPLPEVIYEDLIRLDDKVYRISEKKGIKEAFTMSTLKETPNIETKAGDYYIGTTDYQGVVIYDSKLNTALVYELPSYADGNNGFRALNNGNVLVQYVVPVGEYTDEYDYIKDGKKYDLVSVLMDPDDGECKEIDLSFVVDNIYNADTIENNIFDKTGLDKDMENLATIYPIENKRVDTSTTGRKIVILTNKAKIDGYVDGYITGMLPVLNMVAPNRWLLENSVGQKFVINHKGKVLGEVSNLDKYYCNDSYFVHDTALYDWNLKKVLDTNEDKIRYYHLMKTSVILTTDDGKTVLLKDGALTTLLETAEVGITKITKTLAIIETREDNKHTALYNDLGQILYEAEGNYINMEYICSDKTHAVYRLNIQNKPVYLILK